MSQFIGFSPRREERKVEIEMLNPYIHPLWFLFAGFASWREPGLRNWIPAKGMPE
jgi:hypothetical protein